jgi:hypothetical protein
MVFMPILSASSNSIFKNWVFNTRSNRILLVISAGVILTEWIIFKRGFPFPNFIPESEHYIGCALTNRSLNVWPIAYSKFLRIFNTFTSSDTGLVTFQYLFLQSSIIYFLFSVSWLLKLPRLTIRILFILNLLNPIVLHLANFVSSDALFVGLSLIWFTQMLWLIRRPQLNILCLHALVLLLAFSLRFFAIYYPIVSIILLSLLHTKLKVKMIGVVVIIIPLVMYIDHEVHEYEVLTKTTQFSAFGGWQLSGNALYAYAHTPPDSPADVPAAFRPLHALVNQHMRALSHLQSRPDDDIGIYYQWDEQSPLKRYMRQYWLNDSTTDPFTEYAVMGKLYAGYGAWLVRRHPVNYFLYYALPNAANYFFPEPDHMAVYNMGFDSVAPVISTWFEFKTNKVGSLNKAIGVVSAFTNIVPLVNILFIVPLLFVMSSKGYLERIPLLNPFLRIVLILWVINMLFSVFSSWAVLRYEIFPLIVALSFAVICISFLVEEFLFTKSKSVPPTRLGEPFS